MFSKKEDKYLAELSKSGYLETPREEIQTSIEKKGYWQEYEEWRISTITEFKIEKEPFKDEMWFRVFVKCDYEFGCVCPTLDRAIEMAVMYQQLIMRLFVQVGWPSWASKEHVS
ncbi:MAG: hypothetical protein KJ725_03115 [Gammaproteobacteria bacterium]|nr:hypothetical protein [Gammaproteobacteria bacterium]